MAIGSQLLKEKILSPEDMKRAVMLMTEMKSRGIAVPDNIDVPASSRNHSWNLDANGYVVRNDGWKFNPRPVLEAFIASRSRFILLKSGRGGERQQRLLRKR